MVQGWFDDFAHTVLGGAQTTNQPAGLTHVLAVGMLPILQSAPCLADERCAGCTLTGYHASVFCW